MLGSPGHRRAVARDDFPGDRARRRPRGGGLASPRGRPGTLQGSAREAIRSSSNGAVVPMKPPRWLCPLARLSAALGAMAVLHATEARGDLISFDFDPNRSVIVSVDGSASYSATATTGDFHVQVTDLFYLSNNLPGGAPDVAVDNGSAVIDLTVDKSGNLVGVGSITVTGGVDFDQDGTDDVSGTLLTGSVTQFGAAGAGPAPWEFDGLFTFTGGGLTQSSIPLSGGGSFADLFKVGETGGFDLVVEQQVSGILGDFLASFSGNTIKGPAVGVSVPEPSAAALSFVGLAAVAGWTRLRRCSREPGA